MKKNLYIDVDSYEKKGSRSKRGNGRPYSSFDHTVIEVNSWGPLYFSEEGKGYDSHQVDNKWYYFTSEWKNGEKVEQICYHPSEEECQDSKSLFVVIIRYSDGGTFDTTEGYFSFPYVDIDEKKCINWVNENKSRIAKAYSGHFESLEECIVKEVQYLKDHNDVSEKRWWGPEDFKE